MTRRPGQRSFIAICAGLAIFFGLMAWDRFHDLWLLGERGQRTQAEILWYEPRGARTVREHPRLRFTTAAGGVVSPLSPTPADPASAPRGSRIAVVYDPERPDRVRLLAAFEAGADAEDWGVLGFALAMAALAAGALLRPGAFDPWRR